MSEFWGFHATRLSAPIDRKKTKAALKKLKVKAAVLTEGTGWLYLHSPDKAVLAFADVMFHYFSHEGAAWDFKVYVKGKKVGSGVFGTNLETGADDRGFEGDLAATAKALGVDAKALKKTFGKSETKFFKLLGLEHMAMPESEVPKGIAFFDELET